METWVVYSRECGFNIIEAQDEQEAENMAGQDFIALDLASEFDGKILSRIRELL